MGLSIDAFRDLLDPAGILDAAQCAQRPAALNRQSQPRTAIGLLRPRSTAELSQILKRCHAHRQPVTVQGGISGSCGAISAADEIAISLERMAAVEEIDSAGRTVLVQAGCLLHNLHEAVAAHGLYYGVDYGGRGSATLGGNISTNAGGLNVLRYGMTREQVLGLEAVLADGTVISSMNRMLKNNAGYDLKQLFIGTEGTLGVVTRAILRLRPQPLSDNVALLAMSSFEQVRGFLAYCEQRYAGVLTSFEVMWQRFYMHATAEGGAPLPDLHPFYVIVETRGTDPAADAAHFEHTLARALEDGMFEDAAMSDSRARKQAIWAVRERVEWLVRRPVRHVFDLSLPVREMERYVADLERDLAARWPRAELIVFGHIADGNLHVFVTMDEAPLDFTYEALCGMVYPPLTAFHGSIAAEHGVGREKVASLHYSRTEEELALMRTLKRCLDPHNILNPGRVVAL
ncbi:FAD-binding oxidoreductase [Massilia putida]|uniref:FAD-binding oxidoreductase n=1 Tax=Massilia putida TaxID=1141883 RepID=UPI000951571F|nr:FAD-binding oxidoreductase [Massilia putida]